MKTRAVCVKHDNKIIDLSRISPARMPAIRAAEAEGEITCAACGTEVEIHIDDLGPFSWHTGNITHEAEDRQRIEDKIKIHELMKNLFPTASVEQNVYLEEANRFADVVIVKDNGGILAIEYRTNDMLKGEITAVLNRYTQAAILPMFMLDARRLKLKGIRQSIARGHIGKMEVDLARAEIPLIYLDEDKWYQVFLPERISPLIKSGKPTSFGKIPIAIRRHMLDELRIRHGQWFFDEFMNRRLPEPPPLPQRLLKMIKDKEDA